jgi:hypothetical protein
MGVNGNEKGVYVMDREMEILRHGRLNDLVPFVRLIVEDTDTYNEHTYEANRA